MRDLKDNSTQVVLFPALRRGFGAESGSYTGTVVDLAGEGRRLLAVLSVGKVATNTLTLTIQESVDNSAWTTLYAFTAITADGSLVIDLTPTKRYIRAIATLVQTNTFYVDFALIGAVYNERYRPSSVA